MSVGRLYRNLSSSDITWNRLHSALSMLPISEVSEEENVDDEEDEEDKRFFLRCLCFLGEGEDFSVEGDEVVLL